MTIDVLIATAAKGGVENIIKMMIEDLEGPDMHFRVVQLVWEGMRWLPENVPYYPLLKGKGEYDLGTFTNAYGSFLKENGVPDIVLGTVWPYTICVAKNALAESGRDRNKTKVISWMHHEIGEYKKSFDHIEEWLSLADGHFAINSVNHKILKELFPHKPTYRLRNPIDLPLKIHNGHVNSDSGSNTHRTLKLAFVGRLSEEKNIELLIKAVAKVKECELVVIGSSEDEDYYKKLKDIAESRSTENRIKWMGWQQDPWKCVSENKVDAICLTSYYEGFPLTALEAFAHGIPVIATRTVGISEIVEDGINGYIIEVGDEDSLFNLLERIVEEGINIDPDDCYRTAQLYERHAALSDMNIKLASIALAEELVPDSYDKPWFADEQLIKDKISVIIPCHNSEKYLRNCLDSVLSQNIQVADWEIICVDDASTDGTLNILKEYEQAHEDRIILISLTESVRAGGARNIGLSYASGNYIMYIDSDDMIAPDMLDKLYRNIIKYNVNVMECDYIRFGNGSEPFFSDGIEGILAYDLTDVITRKRYIIENGWRTSVWGRLYLRTFIEENQICFPENIYFEDVFFAEMVTMLLDKLVVIREQLYGYRIHEESTMFSKKMKEYYMEAHKVQCMTSREILKRNLCGECRYEVEMLHFNKSFMGLINKMKEDREYYSFENYRTIVDDLLKIFPDFGNNPYLIQKIFLPYVRLLDIKDDKELRYLLYRDDA